MMKTTTALAWAILVASAADAQTAPAPGVKGAPAPMTIAAPIVSTLPNGMAVLRTGTEVPLRLSEELTTKGKKLRVGQRFRMEVAENVVVQNQAVIPAGSPAVGEITDVRNKGMWSKSGHLGARILYATVNGRQIRMTGAFDDKGTAGGIGATAVSALVFLPAGFFMTGTSATVPMGAAVKGFVDEDVPLSFANAGPAPLLVGTPTTAIAAVAPAPVSMPAQTLTPAPTSASK